jgi:hypothetical protein
MTCSTMTFANFEGSSESSPQPASPAIPQPRAEPAQQQPTASPLPISASAMPPKEEMKSIF